jgi:hypothetical protein
MAPVVQPGTPPPVLKPIYLVDALGEQARVPDGAIINIGGVAGPTFTVGGKALLFADGSDTGGGVISPEIDFQSVYNSSAGEASISFVSGKDLVLEALNGNQFRFDADTGLVTITGNLVVQGSSQPITAENVSVDQANLEPPITGTTVQQVIEQIATEMASISTAELVKAYEHVQLQPLSTWTISHNQGTRKIQVSIWDNTDALMYADTVTLVDQNTVTIEYNTPVTGRAVLMLF